MMSAKNFKQRGTTARWYFAALVLIAMPTGHVFGQEIPEDVGQYTPIGDDVLSPSSDYTPIGDELGSYTPIGDVVENFDWESLRDDGTLNSMCGAGSGGNLAFAMMGLVGLVGTNRRGRRR